MLVFDLLGEIRDRIPAVWTTGDGETQAAFGGFFPVRTRACTNVLKTIETCFFDL